MFCLFGGIKPTFIENSFLASIWGSIVPYPLHHVVDLGEDDLHFSRRPDLDHLHNPSFSPVFTTSSLFFPEISQGWGMVLLLALVSPAVADDAAFDQWMLDLRAEARGVGISEATLDAALTGVKLAPKVVKLDRNQPEFKLTFQGYKDRMVTLAKTDSRQETD